MILTVKDDTIKGVANLSYISIYLPFRNVTDHVKFKFARSDSVPGMIVIFMTELLKEVA